MKKMFVAVMAAAALSSYSFAQDYGAPYQEQYPQQQNYQDPYQQQAPQTAPYQGQPQPAYQETYPQPQQTYDYAQPVPQLATGSSTPFFGIGLDLEGLLNSNYNIRASFRLNESMELSAILGLWHHGETTAKTGGVEADAKDNHTLLNIGAAFDYYLMQNLIPLSVGGELIYSMDSDGSGDNANDYSQFQINILAGAHAKLVENLYLTGNAGLSIQYIGADNGTTEASRWDVGLCTRVYLSWFVL